VKWPIGLIQTIKRWQLSGAEYIGGCCGIGAKEIADLNLN